MLAVSPGLIPTKVRRSYTRYQPLGGNFAHAPPPSVRNSPCSYLSNHRSPNQTNPNSRDFSAVPLTLIIMSLLSTALARDRCGPWRDSKKWVSGLGCVVYRVLAGVDSGSAITSSTWLLREGLTGGANTLPRALLRSVPVRCGSLRLNRVSRHRRGRNQRAASVD